LARPGWRNLLNLPSGVGPFSCLERRMIAITADLKTKDLALGMGHFFALHGFHEVSRAGGPKRQSTRVEEPTLLCNQVQFPLFRNPRPGVGQKQGVRISHPVNR